MSLDAKLFSKSRSLWNIQTAVILGSKQSGILVFVALVVYLTGQLLPPVAIAKSAAPPPISTTHPINTRKSQPKSSNKLGQFYVTYVPSSHSRHQQLNEALQKSQIFNLIVQDLNNSRLVMRNDLLVIIKDCNQVNAYYDPQEQTITICHEFILSAAKDFEKTTHSAPRESLENALYATIFAFYHELGHALIHILDLPAVGQEEDAVDEFAAIILLNSKNSETAKIVLNGAIWFGSQPQGPFWDEHPPGDKRFFNLLCLIYGSDPETYTPVLDSVFQAIQKEQAVAPGELKRRATMCKEEYPRKLASWNKLLLPHFAQGSGGWGIPVNHPNPALPTPNQGRGRVW